jgi:GT2 family glycosyltransferase
MTHRFNVLVVYVNYLGCEDIIQSITSLKRHCSQPLDIVVVDNSPTDDCGPLRIQFKDIQFVQAPDNLGFAGGCNLGISSARKPWDYVLLLNPDTYCQADFLTPLLVQAESGFWGVLSPKIINRPSEEENCWYAGSTLNWWRGGPRQVRNRQFIQADGAVEVPFASGCCSLISSAAWALAGPIDSSFFLYFEDADFAERVKKHGLKIGYVPGVSIVHKESTTTGYQSSLYLYYFSRNRLLFLNRWAPRSAKLVYFFFHFFVKLPGSWIIFGLINRDWRRSLAFTLGAIDGLLGRTGPNWRWHNS